MRLPVPVRRILAFGLDWLLFLVWAVALFGVVFLLQDGEPAWPADPWQAQGLAILAVTLPFGLYLGLCEASRARATVGKRALGLQVGTVVAHGGGKASPGRIAIRTVGKLLPWEMGHTMAHQLVAHPDDPPTWAGVVGTLSTLLAIVFVVSLWRGRGRTPYDLAAGTAVVDRSVAATTATV